MFCEHCGKRITKADNTCSACRKPQSPLTNGNGFWDLCDEPKSKNSDVVAPVIHTTVAAPEATKSSNSLVVVVSILAAMCALTAGILFAKYTSKAKDYKDLRSENEELADSYANDSGVWASEKESISADIVSKDAQISGLEEENSAKSEAISSLEADVDELMEQIKTTENTTESSIVETEETSSATEAINIVDNDEVENPILPGSN